MDNLLKILLLKKKKIKLEYPSDSGGIIYREKGTGRPTKKERRLIDRLKDDFDEPLKWWYKDLIFQKSGYKSISDFIPAFHFF